VKIIKSEMRKEDPNNKYDEDTRVIKIDRPLTKKEIIELCTSLGQIAIPQMSGETGTLWGPKQVLIDRNYDGGKFNIDYFKLFSSEDAESFDAEGEYICPHCSNRLYRLDLTEKYTCPDCEGLIYEDFRDGYSDPADFMAESFEAEMNCNECGQDYEGDEDFRNCDLCNVLLCGGCNRRCEGCSNTVCDEHRCSKECCDGAYCDECHEDEYGAESYSAEGQERNCASCNIGIVGEMTPCDGCGEYYCLDLEGKTGKLACQTLDGMCKDCHPKDENWKMNFGFEYDAENFSAQEYGTNCNTCGGFLKDCIGYVHGEPCNQAGSEPRLCTKCEDDIRCSSCRQLYFHYEGADPHCDVCNQIIGYDPISNLSYSHKGWCKWDAGYGQTAGTCETCWSEPWMWSNDLGYLSFNEGTPHYNSDIETMCLHCMEEDYPEAYEELINQIPEKESKEEIKSKKWWKFWNAESFEANWGGVSNMPGHPLNPSRPSEDRGDRLRPRRPIRRPRRRPYNAEVFGQDIDNKVIGIVAIAAIIGGWLFNKGKD
jgi:hypothetical protein